MTEVSVETGFSKTLFLKILINSSCGRELSLYAAKYCLESMEKARSHKSEPEPRIGIVNTAAYSSGEIFELVAQSLFTINKYALANVGLYCVLPA